MSYITNELLAGLFAVHLAAFTILWLMKRKNKYLLTILTFFLLTCAYLLKVFAIELEIGGINMATGLRHAAWVTLAITIILLIYLRIAQRKQNN